LIYSLSWFRLETNDASRFGWNKSAPFPCFWSSAHAARMPRSQVEMSDYDLQWQEKINKVVRRVAKDLIANDEAEISEVVRKRLFEDIGSEKIRKSVAKAYVAWCFERRNQLPPEWTAVDTGQQRTRKHENFSEHGSKPAIHSILRPYRFFIASGKLCASSSRHVAH